MADIFISYARADRDQIEKLAAALEGDGYSVWWDRNIVGGSEFSEDIERELGEAGAVIVGWSQTASKSKWVKDEASVAADAGKLIAVSLDGADPPIGYRQYHCLDLKRWHGSVDDSAFIDVTRAVQARIDGNAPPPVALDHDNERRPWRVLITATAAALVVVIAAWFLVSRGPPTNIASNAPSAPTDLVAIDEKSIAVLPFAALSQDESDAYFGKGLAEELLNALARFPNLKVAARTSAFAFEGKDVDIREIADQLGVSHILEGSVRRSGDQLRVTAQLIRASDGFHLWSNTYSRQATDYFAIEDDIVRNISRTLEIQLGVGSGTGRADAKGVDPTAYKQYLRGLTLWGERDVVMSNRREAHEAFRLATELDPDFADAWAMLANFGVFSSGSAIGVDAQTMIRQTEDAFERALALDPNNGVVHAALTTWHSSFEIDIKNAEAHMQRALALSPGRAETHYAIANYHFMVGNLTAALRAFDKATALDPLNMIVWRVRSDFLASIGRFDEAFIFYDQCLAENCLAAGFPAYALTGALLSSDGERIHRWKPVYEKLHEMMLAVPANHRPEIMRVFPTFVDLKLGTPGTPEETAALLEALQENPVLQGVGNWTPAFSSIAPAEQIIDWLHMAYEQKALFTAPYALSPYYGTNPYTEEVLRHPRYHELWERPGMAELAATRRANGWEGGLPLPENE